jgi:hypothetical protein
MTSLKIESNCFGTCQSKKESVGEGYFIRVLEVLDKQEIALGSEIEIIEKESFDSL